MRTLWNLLFLPPQRGHKQEAPILLFSGYPVLTMTIPHPSNKINTYQTAEARNYTTHFPIFLERVI
jgi:hypothetical protein